MGTAYIGRKPCGCLVAAMADDLSKNEIAKELAEWVHDGLIVEHVDDDVVRNEFTICKHTVKETARPVPMADEREVYKKMAIWNAKVTPRS